MKKHTCFIILPVLIAALLLSCAAPKQALPVEQTGLPDVSPVVSATETPVQSESPRTSVGVLPSVAAPSPEDEAESTPAAPLSSALPESGSGQPGPSPSPVPEDSQPELKRQACLTITGPEGKLAGGCVDVFACPTVFDALKEVCRSSGLELNYTGAGSMVYIVGIGGIAEKDHGPLSGWQYTVNGQLLSIGCGAAQTAAEDSIEFFYTEDFTKQ